MCTLQPVNFILPKDLRWMVEMMLYTHYFHCEDCKTVFRIMITNERHSNLLGTIDCRASCPNSMCKSDNTVMDDVEVVNIND